MARGSALQIYIIQPVNETKHESSEAVFRADQPYVPPLTPICSFLPLPSLTHLHLASLSLTWPHLPSFTFSWPHLSSPATEHPPLRASSQFGANSLAGDETVTEISRQPPAISHQNLPPIPRPKEISIIAKLNDVEDVKINATGKPLQKNT